jgi:hypothetical protein
MPIEAPYYPIVYIRGFAPTKGEMEETSNTPYQGFNDGSTRIRQKPTSEGFDQYIFESPLIRLMKEYKYMDTYIDGSQDGSRKLDPRSISIFRYYEDDSGNAHRPSMEDAARKLSQHIEKLRSRICQGDPALESTFKVYIVAHSMGGLICRILLQNPRIGSEVAKLSIDKVFTYGTPHNGIDIDGINIGSWLGLFDINNFSRDRMAQYLDVTPQGENRDVNFLTGHFPPERFFCFVGTNHRDYNWLLKRIIRDQSDGLVKIKNAYIRNAPRVMAYLSHSGPHGMVNSVEGYENLVRFLFGNVRASGTLVPIRLPLPLSVDEERKRGKNIRGSYMFDCIVTPRSHPPTALSERQASQSSAIFRTYDEMMHPDRVNLNAPRNPVLFSVFLDTTKIVAGSTLMFAIDITVKSTDFEVDGFVFDKNLANENLFRETVIVKVTLENGSWIYRYVIESQQPSDAPGQEIPIVDNALSIPLQNAKGFEASLRLTIEPWS